MTGKKPRIQQVVKRWEPIKKGFGSAHSFTQLMSGRQIENGDICD